MDIPERRWSPLSVLLSAAGLLLMIGGVFALSGCADTSNATATSSVTATAPANPPTAPVTALQAASPAEVPTATAADQRATALTGRQTVTCTTKYFDAAQVLLYGNPSESSEPLSLTGSCTTMKWGTTSGERLSPGLIELTVESPPPGVNTLDLPLAPTWRLISVEHREVDGRRAKRIEADKDLRNGSIAKRVQVVVDLDQHVLVASVSSDRSEDPIPWETALTLFDDLLGTLVLRPVTCDIPEGFLPIDFDGDGVDEWIGQSLQLDRMGAVEVLASDPNQDCSHRTAAVGTAFGSAGSPQGWGCESAPDSVRFVDWAVAGGARVTTDGGESVWVNRVELTTTTFEQSMPQTESTLRIGSPPALEPCVDDTDAILSGNPTGAVHQTPAQPGIACENDYWALTAPGEWHTHALPDPLYRGPHDLRCSMFTMAGNPIVWQCDCVPAVWIRFDEGITIDRWSPLRVGAGTVDGYPAVIVEQEVNDSELYRPHTVYSWLVDVGTGTVEIQGSTAEFDGVEEMKALADELAATIRIQNVAPAERLCASAPERAAAGNVVYADFDGDGISEAIVPTELSSESRADIRYVHTVYRSDGACGWVGVDDGQLVQDRTSTWTCSAEGQLATASIDPDGSFSALTYWSLSEGKFSEAQTLEADSRHDCSERDLR